MIKNCVLLAQLFVHGGSGTTAVTHGKNNSCTTAHDVATGIEVGQARLHGFFVYYDSTTTTYLKFFDSIGDKGVGRYTYGYNNGKYPNQMVSWMSETIGDKSRMEKQLKEEINEFDLDFECRELGGVNVITANNALDYYPESTVNRFFKTLENGLPTIVFSHDPLDDKLLNKHEAYHENVKITKEEYEISHKMLDALISNPQVVTTFTGHNHITREYEIEGKTHYLTGGLFKGICRLIEII